MDRIEVKNFLGKIKAYYRYFDTTEKSTFEEWVNKLEPYNKNDVIKKFEMHLVSENRKEPPMLHLLIKDLLTESEQKLSNGDYLITCDLCGKWMKLSTYEKVHRDKCLTAKTLERIIENKEATYDEIMKYDEKTLNRLWEKYKPSETSTKELLETLKC